jgi:hypothetical protein
LLTVRFWKRIACPLPSRHRKASCLVDVCFIAKRNNTDNCLLRCRATFSSGEGFRINKYSLHIKTFPYNNESLLLLPGKHMGLPLHGQKKAASLSSQPITHYKL